MPPRQSKVAPETVARLPVLPLKDVVVFPRMVLPLMIGRDASLNAVEEALASGRPLFLCTQKDSAIEDPVRKDLHPVGVATTIIQTLRMPDGTMKIVVEGMGRGAIQQFFRGDGHDEVRVKKLDPLPADQEKTAALVRVVLQQFEEYVRVGQRVAPDVAMSLKSVADPDVLCDLVCAHVSLKTEERQKLLEMLDPAARLEALSGSLVRENELLGIEKQVRDRVREQMERGQREHYLQEQMRVIQQELGKREDYVDEFSELRALIDKANMPLEVKEKSTRELVRYEKMPPLSPEGTVVRSYLEWLTELPWSKRSKDSINLDKAQKVLDEDHYGLEKVKDRILEFLAVRKLSKSTRGPVLCLVGPPGVGKTSLGRSIARAMGREFVRVSLGGIRDEAEIRGHRRTYIGALPGRILQSMKKVGVKNPVFMLDEVDKMAVDFRGDPASALLEVLDPEQNQNFSDHYLEVDFDLHEVFFVTTANSEYEIPEPLLDRMEVVRLSGYTPFEKDHIAELFLIPKQLTECGLTKDHVSFTKEGIDLIISRYTHEAGVRELERQIGSVCRKVARRVVSSKKKKVRISIDAATVYDLLGPAPYTDIHKRVKAQMGVAIGLAWTQAGGEILQIETTIVKGKGGLQMTGQLGDVMQESGQAAYTYLRARAKELNVPAEFWKNADVHVHVPEGAIPKDGPSAGVAIAVSMLSALKKKAPADKLAMSGEITLLGRVLPVGGVKEKVLAAHRSGMVRVVLPKDNEKDLKDVPAEIKDEISFLFVDSMDDVLGHVFPATKSKAAAKPARKRK